MKFKEIARDLYEAELDPKWSTAAIKFLGKNIKFKKSPEGEEATLFGDPVGSIFGGGKAKGYMAMSVNGGELPGGRVMEKAAAKQAVVKEALDQLLKQGNLQAGEFYYMEDDGEQHPF